MLKEQRFENFNVIHSGIGIPKVLALLWQASSLLFMHACMDTVDSQWQCIFCTKCHFLRLVVRGGICLNKWSIFINIFKSADILIVQDTQTIGWCYINSHYVAMSLDNFVFV